MSRVWEVSIDTYPESAFRHLECDALVCIDVIEATTLMVTAAHQGRSVMLAPSAEDALALRPQLSPTPLLSFPREVGTPTRALPMGLAALARLDDRSQPLIVAGSPGARLVLNAGTAPAVYVACFRNLTATAAALAAVAGKVVLIVAGEEGESRCEDEMAAARIARFLIERGCRPADNATTDAVGRWGDVDLMLVRYGKSVEDLRVAGRNDDLEFILSHVDDLDFVCRFAQGEVRLLERPGTNRATDTAAQSATRRSTEVAL